MKTYTYYFDDGTKSEVEVSDEMYEELVKWDEAERKANYNHNRHCVPLSTMTYEGEDFADPRGDAFAEMMREEQCEKIQSALDQLTDKQRELIDLVYYQKKKVIDIAAEQGVSQQAISDRLDRIRKKLKKLLA